MESYIDSKSAMMTAEFLGVPPSASLGTFVFSHFLSVRKRRKDRTTHFSPPPRLPNWGNKGSPKASNRPQAGHPTSAM